MSNFPQVQRSSGLTPARADSMCIPQPAQVALSKNKSRLAMIKRNIPRRTNLLSAFRASNFATHDDYDPMDGEGDRERERVDSN